MKRREETIHLVKQLHEVSQVLLEFLVQTLVTLHLVVDGL
jgi:hypothetical protein